MASVNIRFVGPWRMYMGIEHFKLDARDVNDVIEQIEACYGHLYNERLARSGVKEKRRICDDSNILLNHIHIRQLADHSLKDGDRLEIIPRFVGG